MDLTPDLPSPQRLGRFRVVALWWGPRPLGQALVILAVLGLLWWLAGNVADSMARIGASPGFAFLGRTANFAIGEAAIPFKPGDSFARAIAVGLINTVKVSLLGCGLATLVGVTLGVAGLSGNLLLERLVRWYVEVVRNTPLLLQLFFWVSLAHALPSPRQAITALDAVYLSNRGVFVPGIAVQGLPPAGWLLGGALLALAIWAAAALARRGALDLGRFALIAGAAAAGLLALLRLSGAATAIELPALAGFNIQGGYSLSPEFAALLTALMVKFSASIAEIVRAGIQSVDPGQREAARALGLGEAQIMRLVVLPQALRLIIPLTTSIYLDLTKDSSLAVAIGYPDLVSILNTTANTTGQAVEALLIMIGAYLSVNLTVSWLMNRYNRRIVAREGRGE